jgi:hypothetical protein
MKGRKLLNLDRSRAKKHCLCVPKRGASPWPTLERETALDESYVL